MNLLHRTERMLLSAILITLAMLLFVPPAAAARVAVIANKSVPDTAVGKSKLLDIYSGDIKRWSNGRPVVVLDLKPNDDIKNTFYQFLGKSPSRMKSVWLKKLLSGEGDPPQTVETEAEMIKRVASTPGAIGFVSTSSVNDTVKTLTIIDSGTEKNSASRTE